MLEQVTSRRAVVGALAVGTVAAGSYGLLTRGAVEAQAADGITVVPGGAIPGFRPIPHEVERWTAAIGRPVELAGEARSVTTIVDSVVPVHAAGRRPANARSQPFLVRLSMDAAGAPAGDRIYALSTPIAGLTEVFLTRGADVGGRAILLAVFG